MSRLIALLFHDVYGRDPGESGFDGPVADRYKIPADSFDGMVAALARAGLGPPVVASADLARAAEGVAITVDDGGVSYYTHIADRLERVGWRGHCFISSDAIGRRGFLTASQLRALHERGHCIGSHSATHPTRFSACSWQQMLEEWRVSRMVLEDTLGAPVVVASLPGGYYSPLAARAAGECGFRVLFTSEPRTSVHRVGECDVAGRFTIRAGTSVERAVALATRQRGACEREWIHWNAKKVARTVLGPLYPRVGAWIAPKAQRPTPPGAPMNITVFGLGYVGCVSAACLARAGHRVRGVDVNRDKVDMVAAGHAPIVEPGLEALLKEVVSDGRLTATTDASEAVAASELALICVGTPGLGHGRPDTSGLERVGRDIGRALGNRTEPLTVVLRSTVLPGTAEGSLLPALRQGAGTDRSIRLAINPEFLREGSAIDDFHAPPFILIGSEDDDAAQLTAQIYEGVDAPVIITRLRTAELVKYASNAFHGLKVCFANEMANLAEALGADGQEVMRIFRQDHKLNVSEAYLRPGYAFGGSCLPKDLRALVWAARAHDVDVPLLSTVLPSNRHQIGLAVDAVLSTRKRRVGVVGLAFKPATDDLRESPVVTLVEQLIGKGLDVRILDPQVSMARLTGANRRYIESEIPHIASLLTTDVDDVVRHAEVLVLANPTPEAARARELAGARMPVIDLSRGAFGRWAGALGVEMVECSAS